MLTPRDYRPRLDGKGALDLERRVRLRALENAHDDPVFTANFPDSNGEEQIYADAVPTNFTKGLYHDETGTVRRLDYEALVKGLREPPEPGNMTPFHIPTLPDGPVPRFANDTWDAATSQASPMELRKWESPLAGLNADLQGPAPAALGQPPVPKLGSSELTAELAEVYAMALLRDVSFKDLENPVDATFSVNGADIPVQELIGELNKLTWFDATLPADGALPGEHVSAQELRRRDARFAPGDQNLTARSLFRGSATGAMTGPYVSQFMLLGSFSRGADSGLVAFGIQDVNQRVQPDVAGLDYLSNFLEWRDVQNGADVKNVAPNESPRFLTTLRDLASYVHFDQLYQAYFVAALMMADSKVSPDHGLPNAGEAQQRMGFATWGVPHLLALLAEVSSRALRVVRRQKFQIHRRARPEALAARLALVANGYGAHTGQACPQFERMLDEFRAKTPRLLEWINARNWELNQIDPEFRGLQRRTDIDPLAPPDLSENLLLPMAFAEGSPMHPAYGAGHATVAGACVTVLKAFFQTVDANGQIVPWSVMQLPDNYVGMNDDFVLSEAGSAETLTGELDKLAANISIGRNMGGVHFYTDYFESVRMGERIATQILYQNMLTSQEAAEMRFIDFDGRLVTLSATPRRDIRFPDAIETDAGIAVMNPANLETLPAKTWWEENVITSSIGS